MDSSERDARASECSTSSKTSLDRHDGKMMRSSGRSVGRSVGRTMSDEHRRWMQGATHAVDGGSLPGGRIVDADRGRVGMRVSRSRTRCRR
jgi:hypothetical protein